MLHGSTNLLGTILLLLALLAATLGIGSQSMTSQTILWFEIHHSLGRIIDQGESGRLATSKGSLEAEADNVGLVDLVHGGEALTDTGFAKVGQAWMGHIDDHLLALEETVSHELASANGNGSVSLWKIIRVDGKILPFAWVVKEDNPGSGTF